MVLGLDNPLGTQPAGSASVLLLSPFADAAYPCGVSVPATGMAGPGAPGELLIALLPPGSVVALPVGPSAGAGNPVSLPLSVPNVPGLIGRTVFAQGVLVSPGALVSVGLTDAVEMRLGR